MTVHIYTQTYAGIGARNTPSRVLSWMNEMATRRAANEWLLRSGGARGADYAFQSGAGKHCEIFTASSDIPQWAFDVAEEYHPAWDRLSGYVRKLMARNSMIIFGEAGDDPVDEIICWTLGGEARGGTGQALRIAEDWNIPVTNLYHRWIEDERAGLAQYTDIEDASEEFILRMYQKHDQTHWE